MTGEPETDRRPRWRKKRWWAAGLLWLAVAYPLSHGPVVYAARLHLLSQAAADAYGRPIERLLPRVLKSGTRFVPMEADPQAIRLGMVVPNWRPNPWTRWYWSYVDRWEELARRHAGF